MGVSDSTERRASWLSFIPPAAWLSNYQRSWLPRDLVAGITLAAYAIPVSLAYAALAGLPPQLGIYGYLLGGLGYALLGSSRQLAVGPTSAISLMIAGTVAVMAAGDANRYIEIATLAAFAVALLCLMAWLLRLSILVRLISESILIGFKAGAGLTIAASQLPSLLGVPGGGHNFLERIINLAGELGSIHPLTLAIGLGALLLLILGERYFPGKPVGLLVVALSIAFAGMFDVAASGVAVTGPVPPGLPSFAGPTLRLRDVEGIFPLALGCLLLAYIESVSAARTFAAKHGYVIDPRQEFLGLGAANLAAGFGGGYPVAGGLSQSAVNDKAGARTPLALIFTSATLALCLLLLTNTLANLPKAVLAAIVLTAVYGLINLAAMLRIWRISRVDFYAAAIALVAVLLLGILQGVLLAAAASVLLVLARASHPHVAFLGRIPGTDSYSDVDRHPENEQFASVLAFRPEASLLYVNAEAVMEVVMSRLAASDPRKLRLCICDLSASPYMDLAGSRMLHDLHAELATHRIPLRIVGARGRVRDLLRADGIADKVGGLDRLAQIDDLIREAQNSS
jgi:high affinity sulfate transporter 1